MLTPTRILVVSGAALLGLLLLALWAIGVEGEPTSDAVSQAEVHALTGGVSTAGLLIWGATAGAAAMAGVALRGFDQVEASRFLLISAAGIGYLGLDDALLLHEDILPNQAGISEPVVMALLVVGAIVWAVVFRALILTTDVALLAVAAIAFATSILIDLLGIWSIAGEDWVGYVGLAALCGWTVDTCLRQLGASRSS
ncbi:MAG: hypothetical protein WD404_04305 [Solirubrobacterales bacterium]